MMEMLKNKKIIGAIVIVVIVVVMAFFGGGRSYEDVVDDYYGGAASFDGERVVSTYHDNALKQLGFKDRADANRKIQMVFDVVKEKTGGNLNSSYEIFDVRGTENLKEVSVLVTNFVDYERGVISPRTARKITLSKVDGDWYIVDEYDTRDIVR